MVHRILRCPSLLSALGRSACQPCWCSRAQRSPASPHLSLPPGNVAELGSSAPLRGSLQQLVWPSPGGHPLQDTELAAQTTPEASLERLAPLADYLAAWKLLPNVSAWVLRTVERGYRIQFGAPPPPFNGVFPTVVSPEQGLVMEQKVETLLRKEVAIEVVPPQDGESGFYSRSDTTESSVMRLKFKMLTINQVVSQIRSEDWFVTIDLKDAYFHVSILPQHRKFLRFAFRGEAYQYRVLPFGLALSPHTFHKVCGCCSGSAAIPGHPHTQLHRRMVDSGSIGAHGGSTSRCCSRSFERAGVETERQEECAVSITENHLSRRGVGLDHDAGTFLTCSDQGPVLGAPCHRVTLATDASLTGWGAVMSGHPARGLWSSRHLTWHINCLEMLAMFRALKHFLPDLIGHHVLVRTDNTAVVYYFNHQGGLCSRPLYKLAHQILVWSQDKLLTLRAVHVPGHLNMGADILSREGLRPGEWMLHPEVVKQIWSEAVFGQAQVDLFATKENAQCHHWCSLTYPAPLGLDAMVQTWPRLRLYAFPLIALLPGVLERVRWDGVLLLLVAPYWPAQAWFSDLISLLDGSPWEIPVRRDLLSQAGCTIPHPRPELWKLWHGHIVPLAFSDAARVPEGECPTL
ncbi:hypothetical protein M9458_056262, partial [Cirrhinus mrigala]